MLYNGVSVSALQQSESAVHIHIFQSLLPLASPSHPQASFILNREGVWLVAANFSVPVSFALAAVQVGLVTMFL